MSTPKNNAVPDHSGTLQSSRRATANSTSSSLLDSMDAAAFCGIGLNNFLQRTRKGEIPALKYGRTWRFRQSDLVAWLEHQIMVQTQSRKGE
jgi:excisionase family DNA binding protein